MSLSSSSSSSGSISARGKVTVDTEVLELGDRELGQITLKIMEIPLQGPGGYVASLFRSTSRHGLMGKHDYVMLEYGSPGEWIKAEKTGESRRGGSVSPAGLHLTLETEPGGGEVRHQMIINGPGPGVKWTMAKVTGIMSRHDPNYELLSLNCWKYAFYCAEAILKWCIENATDGNVKRELKRELEKLKPLEKPMPKSAMKWVLNPSDPESIKTGELLEQKMTHTVGKLKESNPKSIRAKMLSKVLHTVTKRNDEYRRTASSSEESSQTPAS